MKLCRIHYDLKMITVFEKKQWNTPKWSTELYNTASPGINKPFRHPSIVFSTLNISGIKPAPRQIVTQVFLSNHSECERVMGISGNSCHSWENPAAGTENTMAWNNGCWFETQGLRRQLASLFLICMRKDSRGCTVLHTPELRNNIVLWSRKVLKAFPRRVFFLSFTR